MGNPSSLCKPPAAFSSGVFFLSVSSFEGKDVVTMGATKINTRLKEVTEEYHHYSKVTPEFKRNDGSFLTLR